MAWEWPDLAKNRCPRLFLSALPARQAKNGEAGGADEGGQGEDLAHRPPGEPDDRRYAQEGEDEEYLWANLDKKVSEAFEKYKSKLQYGVTNHKLALTKMCADYYEWSKVMSSANEANDWAATHSKDKRQDPEADARAEKDYQQHLRATAEVFEQVDGKSFLEGARALRASAPMAM